MSRSLRMLALAGLFLTLGVQTADAHGNPNYRSHILRVHPAVRGVSLAVGDYNADLILTNHSGRTVTVLGYQGEPYARILANGTAQVNTHSPADYLNQDYYGSATVPKSASPHAVPQWKSMQENGTFEWHDHRIHWMSRSLPPQVKDKSKTTKIFNWTVPIEVGAKRGVVAGDLYWHGQDNTFPLWALISLIVLAGVAIPGSVWVHRRRMRAAEGEAGSGGVPKQPREAW